MTMKLHHLISVTAVIALTTAPLTAVGKNYTANVFFSQTHVLSEQGYVDWAEKVSKATNGAINFEVFTGGSLLPPAASMQGLRDGVAHVGYHAGTYTPAELPIMNVISDLSFVNPDPLVMAFASTEFAIFYPAMQEEWKENGIVYGGGYATTPYHLMCRMEINSINDLKGKKLRVPGSAWSRFATHVGATTVSVPSSEMYTGLDSGSLDCVANAADALESFSLKDVVKSIVTLPLGVYFAGFEWGYNPSFWQGLDDAQRKILFNEMALAMVRIELKYQINAAHATDNAAQLGVTVVAPTDDMQASLDSFVAADIANVKQIAREKRGIGNPDSIIDDFLAVVTKWDRLLQDVDRTNEAALTELVKREIYDKIDPSTYGL